VQKNQPLIFGPINSRRFGRSLGVDLSPNGKQCNFDCLYCELIKSKTMSKQIVSINVKEYIEAIKETLSRHNNIDVITLTANGEPTMYPYLNELIDEINKIKRNEKLLILSNSSLINNPNVVSALMKIDIVKLSLDCATKECFKKLDKIDKSINSDNIIDGIIKFSKIFPNELVLEVLFVKNINDKDDEISKMYELIKQINPTRVDIGTIDRPPAYDVKPVTKEFLIETANKMTGINITIAHKNNIKQNEPYTNIEILNLLSKRPLTVDDIENLFDENSKQNLKILVQENKIKEINLAGVVFYKTII
jgi:wyosine [tRNA(Phe)-imidazoG37] synthetase (radical SAM superfamily)